MVFSFNLRLITGRRGKGGERGKGRKGGERGREVLELVFGCWLVAYFFCFLRLCGINLMMVHKDVLLFLRE